MAIWLNSDRPDHRHTVLHREGAIRVKQRMYWTHVEAVQLIEPSPEEAEKDQDGSRLKENEKGKEKVKLKSRIMMITTTMMMTTTITLCQNIGTQCC